MKIQKIIFIYKILTLFNINSFRLFPVFFSFVVPVLNSNNKARNEKVRLLLCFSCVCCYGLVIWLLVTNLLFISIFALYLAKKFLRYFLYMIFKKNKSSQLRELCCFCFMLLEVVLILLILGRLQLQL